MDRVESIQSKALQTREQLDARDAELEQALQDTLEYLEAKSLGLQTNLTATQEERAAALLEEIQRIESQEVSDAESFRTSIEGLSESLDAHKVASDEKLESVSLAVRESAEATQTYLEEAISELRRFLWFDEHTRMAVISFALYNGNYNLYSAVRFIFEVTPGGAIVPSYSMRVLKLDLYDNVRDFNQAFDNYLVIVDIALYTLVFRLLILELISWARIRWRYGTSAPYLSNIWNVMELVNITPFFVSAAVRISFSSADQRYMFNMFVSRYQELGVVAEMYITTFQLDSISVLISVLKLFKYFRMSDALNMLWLVLSRAARDIGFFFLVLGLFLVAFSMTAEQMFGESMEIFSTTFLSVSALAQMLLGVVDVYEDMVASDIIKGFAFFIGYICMMFLILLNIFLAILNDAYAKVQADKEEKKQAAQAALEALEDARDAGTAPAKRTMGERVRLLRQVARGRFYRFGRRVAALRRRKDDEKFD